MKYKLCLVLIGKDSQLVLHHIASLFLCYMLIVSLAHVSVILLVHGPFISRVLQLAISHVT